MGFQLEEVITDSHEHNHHPVQAQMDLLLAAETLKDEEGKCKHENPLKHLVAPSLPVMESTCCILLMSSTRVHETEWSSSWKQLPHQNLSETDDPLQLCQMAHTFPWLWAAEKREGLGISAHPEELCCCGSESISLNSLSNARAEWDKPLLFTAGLSP